MSRQQHEPTPATLQITQVTVRRLWNLGHYENITIEAQALVYAGDDPSDTLAALREWVDEHGPVKDTWGQWTLDTQWKGQEAGQ